MSAHAESASASRVGGSESRDPRWSRDPALATNVTSPNSLREADMLARLRTKFGKRYKNGDWEGPRYITASHVKVDPSYDHGIYSTRIADFMAVDTWRSGAYAVHGFEVKVSRSDWLTELRQPEKSDAIKRFCDRWWLAVSDAGIVRDDLPDGWGLIVARGKGLSVAVDAPNLSAEPLPRTVLAGLIRATAKAAT